MPLRKLAVVPAVAVSLLAPLLTIPEASAGAVAGQPRSAGPATAPAPTAPPALTTFLPVRVEVVATGLTLPWDVTFTPSGGMIVTQRGGPLKYKPWGQPIRTLRANLADANTGEGPALLGAVVDPAFATNRLFYTCQLFKGSATQAGDVRVIRWRLSADALSATRQGQPVVKGIAKGDGVHVGCRVRFGANRKLHVGTGDAQIGANPQNLQSLAGKDLRVNPDGTIPTDNPFYSRGGNARYVWTYGHRNIQGLALRPGTGQMYNAEHGPDRDDEININVKGGNMGWDPVPGYNQTVPMTDLTKFPNAVRAKWSSGFPTVAPAGIEFLNGSLWGSWNGALVMALLKDTGVKVFTVDAAGNLTPAGQIPELDGTHGRLRTVQQGPGGALYVTTSNGSGRDKILRVTPR